jgi:hypothetical protein
LITGLTNFHLNTRKKKEKEGEKQLVTDRSVFISSLTRTDVEKQGIRPIVFFETNRLGSSGVYYGLSADVDRAAIGKNRDAKNMDS